MRTASYPLDTNGSCTVIMTIPVYSGTSETASYFFGDFSWSFMYYYSINRLVFNMDHYDRIALAIFILSGAWIAALLAANKTRGCTVHVGYDIGKVEAKARALAAHSWEYGTLAEALLELYNPELSVFGSNPFPKDKIPKVKAKKVKALSYAKRHILTHNQTLCDGNGQLGLFFLLMQ